MGEEGPSQDQTQQFTTSHKPSKVTTTTTDQVDNLGNSCDGLVNTADVSLIWNNLSYTIKQRNCYNGLTHHGYESLFKTVESVILHEQSGQINTGTFTAIMGKSGSGKTTLIESLAGRRSTGLDGNIRIIVRTKGDLPVKLSFIPQQDHHLDTLTVEESLFYASMLKNINVTTQATHTSLVNKLIKQLDLENCRRVYNLNCSGGQKKRLSIALELVAKPTILVLDEPTSGLDSASALECVRLLRRLSESLEEPLAIMATIHQPNSEILFLFHQIYLLSHNGRLIYFGPTNSILNRFTEHEMQCPDFHNPADHAIEIACGDYGEDVIHQMEESQRKQYQRNSNLDHIYKVYDVSTALHSTQKLTFGNSLRHIRILLNRTLLTTVRDPVLNFLRLLQHVLLALIIWLLYNQTIGQESGCLFSGLTLNQITEKQKLTTQSVSYFFFTLLFLCFASLMSTVMVFPLEMSVFLKERSNGWYSTLTYYLAKTIADIPFQVAYTFLFVYVTYTATGQIQSTWRFLLFLMFSTLLSAIGQSYGLLIGAILSNNVSAAIFVAPVLAMASVLVSGFFAKVSTMPTFLKTLAGTSFMRYAFEGSLISIYGYGRCDTESLILTWGKQLSQTETCHGLLQLMSNLNSLNITYDSVRPLIEAYADVANTSNEALDLIEKQMDKVIELGSKLNSSVNLDANISSVILEYDLFDEFLYFDISMLVLIFTVLRILIYFVILGKSHQK